jgi:hypothetical protein
MGPKEDLLSSCPGGRRPTPDISPRAVRPVVLGLLTVLESAMGWTRATLPYRGGGIARVHCS